MEYSTSASRGALKFFEAFSSDESVFRLST